MSHKLSSTGTNQPKGGQPDQEKQTPAADTQKEDTLRKLESELNRREVSLLEREIKSLRMQEELDRLRPLSGLYRVV